MTALIGGAVLLVAGATVALLFGWGQGDDNILLLSLAASAVAGVVLAVAYVLSKKEAKGEPKPATEEVPAEASDGPSSTEEAEPEAAPAGASDADVVAFATRKRFHKPDCRYAARPGAETISRAEAVERGYQPCGICKP
jgi:hypothetical protein